MKRLIHSLLAAAVLVSAMTVTAFASTPETFAHTTDINGALACTNSTAGAEVYTATYTGVTPGKDYVLLVVKGDANTYKDNLTKDPSGNLLYIYQKAAEANGTISFSILPMAVENSVVVLGGGNEPVILGTINKYVPPYILGDVNNNGKVQINDARLALQISLGKLIPTETQKIAADVNRNGKVQINDARLILQYTLGKIEEF